MAAAAALAAAAVAEPATASTYVLVAASLALVGTPKPVTLKLLASRLPSSSVLRRSVQVKLNIARRNS